MIRFAKVEDIPAILSIYGPYVENTVISFEYVTPSVEEFTQRFLGITERFPWLVWEEDGAVLGYAYGSAPFTRKAYQWSCEVSIYLAPEACGKGIGRKLYRALEGLMAWQGFYKCYALVTSPNSRSLEFHKAMGYRFLVDFDHVGYKMGQWLGVVWLEKELNSVEVAGKEPVPVGQIVKDDKSLQEFLDNLPLS